MPLPALAELVDLTGRRAVVTGAGRGIGAQIVRRLAEAGAAVVAADRELEGVEKLAADATGTVVPLRVDVADTASVDAAAAAAVQRWGGLDIWVNNAGVYPSSGPIL